MCKDIALSNAYSNADGLVRPRQKFGELIVADTLGNRRLTRYRQGVGGCVGPLMRTRTQRCASSDPEFCGGTSSTPAPGALAICQKLHRGAMLSTRHTGRVDFRRERMPAPTWLEGISRDERMRKSWTYDISWKCRPVQLGVHSGCAEHATRVFTKNKVHWMRLSSWYGPPV